MDATTGRKLYFEGEQGISFRSNRRTGDVRIPNYVYDIWMPVLGVTVIGIYSVYCRLEMQGAVKKITQADLARACRVGTDKLTRVNQTLQRCGFIEINAPKGRARLMHWTTEIVINDPPPDVSKEIIDEFAPPGSYQPLTPWLVAPENPNGFSGIPEQVCDENPNGLSNIAPLGLHPLDDNAAEYGDTPPSKRIAPEPPILQEDHIPEPEYVEFDGKGFPARAVPAIVRFIKDYGGRKLAPTYERRLLSPIQQLDRYPSPAHFFDTEPLFREWVREAIDWANGAKDGEKKPTDSLVSAIRNIERDGNGWHIFKEKHTKKEEPLPDASPRTLPPAPEPYISDEQAAEDAAYIQDRINRKLI